MDAEKWFAEELNRIIDADMYREPLVFSESGPTRLKSGGREFLAFCSNDYLGLAGDKRVVQASIEATEKWGAGARASRLISGTLDIHRELEARLAKLKCSEDAILFPSGYMANIGVITSVMGVGDVIISDELNHASIVDGCRLSRAEVRAYSHCSLAHLESILKKCCGYRHRLVVTDGVFSMDGDLAPMPKIVELAKKYDAWVMVDDAHGTGTLGDTGSGILELYNLPPVEIVVGTLSKALGASGGFVCGSADLISILRNRARSFIYTTAVAPAQCGAALKVLDILECEPERVAQLDKNARSLRDGLKDIGYELFGSEEPPARIIPVLIGNVREALRVSKQLVEEGVFVPAIRPPTVPSDSCRLRFTVSAAHTVEDIAQLLGIMRKIK